MTGVPIGPAVAAAPPARHADSDQLVRQWALLRLLTDSPTGLGVKQLAEQLRVTKSTIERDLATLERDFAIVEEQAGKQKKLYRIDHRIRALETVKFGTLELLALYAAESHLGALAGTPLHRDLRAVMHKLRGFLSERTNQGLAEMARVFTPHPREAVDLGTRSEQIDALVDAITKRRVCELTYHAAWKGTTKTHRARPLRLVWHRSALYLFACLGEHRRITTLAVHRIRAVTRTAEEFKPPRTDVDAHIGRAFGIFVNDAEHDVEVHFDPEIAWRVEERVFHPAESKQRRADGTLVYRLRSSAQWEIIPWVQGFGPHAELVAPAAWRASLTESLAAMQTRYGAAAH